MKIEHTIVEKLTRALAPDVLQVINESHSHNVPANSETHFKVVAVSQAFEGKRVVARHQWMYSLLQQELDGEVHALSLHTFTPQEWAKREQQVSASPDCMGGSQ